MQVDHSGLACASFGIRAPWPWLPGPLLIPFEDRRDRLDLPQVSNFRIWTQQSLAGYTSLRWVTAIVRAAAQSNERIEITPSRGVTARVDSKVDGTALQRVAAMKVRNNKKMRRRRVATKKPQRKTKGDRLWPHVILTFIQPRR
jgi:hypothetical protein